mgnify:CR=1 FL=1
MIERRIDVDVVETRRKKNKPEFRICQQTIDMDGKISWRNVGAIWKNTSNNGKEYRILTIGNLRLNVFENTSQHKTIFKQVASEWDQP